MSLERWQELTSFGEAGGREFVAPSPLPRVDTTFCDAASRVGAVRALRAISKPSSEASRYDVLIGGGDHGKADIVRGSCLNVIV